ncbi:V-set and immunoglobulin domain-containing protein 10-like 2 [Oncorhynchus masou masou]|uniref:V-set and immunoglobulin domain-containing protein 10-like 2 n=1 Tax=Oncorhynchus masou masou TaxID=90313 RepID=UPI00318353C1
MLASCVRGVEIIDPGQVVYVDSGLDGVVGKAVILECGSTRPDVYIWGFTQPGTDAIKAVVYDFGKGPKLQKLAQSLGDLQVISGAASLSIERLPLAAEGLYTCQALYDTEQGAKLYYYYIHLRVLVPVSKPYILLSDASPAEGSLVWLRCGLENGTGPLYFLWEHETHSGLVSTVSQGNSSMFNMTEVNRNYTGWYRCVARNQVNQERSDRIWLDIIFGPDIPQIDVTPYSITDRGYSAQERQTVSLLCQAQSNPPSQYVWFYNNSQVYAGPQFTITRILRMHTGTYACLAQNTYLNTRSMKTISLTVYYPPDGSPSCSVLPAMNYSSLNLTCSWPGGLPSPSLRWTTNHLSLAQGGAWLGGEESWPANNISVLQSGSQTNNNSLFTCQGMHPALNTSTQCTARAWSPYGEPVCSAYATGMNQYLLLSCSWEGGSPRAVVWWEVPKEEGRGQELETSKILVLRSNSTQNGQAYTCYAKHPLDTHTRTCSLKLEAPVLLTQRSVVSVFEGSDVQLTCILQSNYPPANQIVWFNNHRQEVEALAKTRKYVLRRAAAWTNLTVLETDGTTDSGQYWCSASNAVGGTEIPVTLLVKRYPMPPNVTLVRLVYSSRQRREVELEWQMEGEGEGGEGGGLTGFILERRLEEAPGQRRGEEEKEKDREEAGTDPADQEQRADTGLGDDPEDGTQGDTGGDGETPVAMKDLGCPPPVPSISPPGHNPPTPRAMGSVTSLISPDPKGRLSKEQRQEKRSSFSPWKQVAVLEPRERVHMLGNMTPTDTYQIRITAVNHRTLGHPSPPETPADPPFSAYPAVIGAAIGGMLIAAIATVLLFMYIIRNRNNNPRLHDMLFGMQHSRSRENINLPDDEVMGGVDGEGGATEHCPSPSPGPSMSSPRAASPVSPPLPAEDNEPVNVTITVMATG